MKFLIMGAGAIGGFVGGALAAGGHDVTLVGRPALMQKIAQNGLTLRRPNLTPQTVFPATTTEVPTDADYDFVLLTVKAPDTARAIEDLSGTLCENLIGLAPKTYIVSLQNGIGNEEQLAAAFGPERVIAGTITIPIQAPEPGVIEVSKPKGGLGLASLHPNQPVQALATALNEAGLPTPAYDDYRAMKWSKLLLNIVTNASSAILDLPPAAIIAQPELFDLEIRALQEGAAVMQAQGIRAVKLPGYPVDWLGRLLSARWLPLALSRVLLRPAMVSGRGAKMPSLHIDLSAGRPTSEIGVLNGAIVETGRKAGVATPVNRALTEILSGLVSGQLEWADYRNQPGKLIEAVTSEQTSMF